MGSPKVDGGGCLGEEVVALVIDDDEGREVFDFDSQQLDSLTIEP